MIICYKVACKTQFLPLDSPPPPHGYGCESNAVVVYQIVW